MRKKKEKISTRLKPNQRPGCICGYVYVSRTDRKEHLNTCGIHHASRMDLLNTDGIAPYLSKCNGCETYIVDLLTRPDVNRTLTSFGVRMQLHVHGGHRTPFLLLRIAAPLRNGFTRDAVTVNYDPESPGGNNVRTLDVALDMLWKETGELLALRKLMKDILDARSNPKVKHTPISTPHKSGNVPARVGRTVGRRL